MGGAREVGLKGVGAQWEDLVGHFRRALGKNDRWRASQEFSPVVRPLIMIRSVDWQDPRRAPGLARGWGAKCQRRSRAGGARAKRPHRGGGSKSFPRGPPATTYRRSREESNRKLLTSSPAGNGFHPRLVGARKCQRLLFARIDRAQPPRPSHVIAGRRLLGADLLLVEKYGPIIHPLDRLSSRRSGPHITSIRGGRPGIDQTGGEGLDPSKPSADLRQIYHPKERGTSASRRCGRSTHWKFLNYIGQGWRRLTGGLGTTMFGSLGHYQPFP